MRTRRSDERATGKGAPAHGSTRRPEKAPTARPRVAEHGASGRGPWWPAALGLAVLTLAVYANALSGGFCYDDNVVILRNANVQDPARILALWTDAYWATSAGPEGWRPLTIFSFHVNYRLGGNAPFGYHMVNVLLHGGCTLLLFRLLTRLAFGQATALVASVVFALHAVHTEAVSQIIGRAELIATLAALGAAVLHVEAFPPAPDHAARSRPTAHRLLCAVGACALLFLGLLGKESAIGMLGIVAATDALAVVRRHRGTLAGESRRWWTAARDVARARWPAWLGYCAAVAAFLAARFLILGTASPVPEVPFVDNPMVGVPPLLRPLASLLLFGKAATLLVLPVHLSADYGFAQLPVDTFWTSGFFWVGFLTLVGLCWVVISCGKRAREGDETRRHGAGVRHAEAVTWGALVLALGWVPVSNALLVIQTILGERTLYLPSLGACVLLAGAFSWARESTRPPVRQVAWVALVTLLFFHAVRTPLRNNDWHSDMALFAATAEDSPKSVRALNNGGSVLMLRGDVAGAEARYRKALALFPAYDDARANLATLLARRGELAEARAELLRILEHNPDHRLAAEHLRKIEAQLAQPAHGP